MGPVLPGELHALCAGAVPSGYLAVGECLSGLSYLLLGSLFFEHLTIHSNSSATGVAQPFIPVPVNAMQS
jgi:hypothetical protein